MASRQRNLSVFGGGARAREVRAAAAAAAVALPSRWSPSPPPHSLPSPAAARAKPTPPPTSSTTPPKTRACRRRETGRTSSFTPTHNAAPGPTWQWSRSTATPLRRPHDALGPRAVVDQAGAGPLAHVQRALRDGRLARRLSRLLTHKRCAVPLSGWFEWKPDEFKEVKKKQPYYTTSTSDEPVWAAALYDVCGELETFTLITRDASASLAWLHDRQPVLLGPTTSTRGSTARRRWRRSARRRPTPRRSRRRRSRRSR